jgi:hypothetical protein
LLCLQRYHFDPHAHGAGHADVGKWSDATPDAHTVIGTVTGTVIGGASYYGALAGVEPARIQGACDHSTVPPERAFSGRHALGAGISPCDPDVP